MKYFSPSYWFKLWVLSAPLFNDKTQGINAKSINNKNIKDWTSKNITNLDSINESLILSNNNKTTDFINYQIYLDLQKLEKNLTTPALSTELAVIPYQHHKHRHEKSRNRHKRGVNGGNEIEYGQRYYYPSFVPEFWEEIVQLKLNNTKLNFESKFSNKIFNERVPLDWKIRDRYNMLNVGEAIYDNFLTISKEFINSSRRERIRIVFYWYFCIAEFASGDVICGLDFYSVNIRTDDSNYFPNKYLENLKNDFPDWNSTETINLGLINDNTEGAIQNGIKQKYPNFDISQISIIDKIDYSYFCQCFLTKIKLTDQQTKYSYGNLKPTFSYTTQTKLNEISNIIANDHKVKQWLKHLNDYNKNLPTKIEHLKTYTDSQKWSFKNTEKEIIKSYIRDWSYVSTLIEQEFKIDELNKNVQCLKANFDVIKNQINDLDKRVIDLENASNWDCGNSGWLVSSITGGVSTGVETIKKADFTIKKIEKFTSKTQKILNVIPVLGDISSTISGLVAASCGIFGV